MLYKALFLIYLINNFLQCYSNDILGCGGFVKSHANIDFSKIEIGLYTKEGSLKEKTECAPTNGYYFLPLYEKGEYILKVHPPAGWSFEPSEVELLVDGENDKCSTGEDINFVFNGFGITGRVITAGQKQGPSGITVELVNDKGDTRKTITTSRGDFHFTPIIPGKYTVKTSHPKWKLDPSQAVVQVKEGNTALPLGALSVKGYDVSGSVISFGSPIAGVHILLYSLEENPKFKVEGCKTALLQGVPDSPICFSVTDASGEFKFGLVPAGDYKLLALSKSPGQATLAYIIKPDIVPFSVKHNSLYIKNAFEVTGFTAIGTVLTGPGGSGISGARVLVDGQPVGNTDATGKFTLSGLKPGTFMLNFQHVHCEFDEVPVVVSAGGVAGLRAEAARWRVCGDLAPAAPRTLLLRPADRAADRAAAALRVTAADDGTWCTFLSPGVYTAKVEVTEQEQRDGLQFYPEQQRVSVARGAVGGVSFGQLRARVAGRVRCGGRCGGLRVALRPLAADGAYAGPPRHAPVHDGEYTFEEVVPGSVEVSVSSDRLCWAEAAHNVAVTQELPPVPDFELQGLALSITTTHSMQVEYQSTTASGVLSLPTGASRHCVPLADQYTLTPRGCHRVEPPQVTVNMDTEHTPSVSFVATAHAVVIRIKSPEPADDIVLILRSEEDITTEIKVNNPTKQDDGYVYEQTVYLAEGDERSVWAHSTQVLFDSQPCLLMGATDCHPEALTLQATPAITLSGRIVPPIKGVVLTLDGGDVMITTTTKADGAYNFGPLNATLQYKIRANKKSYVFDEPDDDGNIAAHKLAEITVRLVDAADDSPLQDALVSVSGGSFRRNAVVDAGGTLSFGALSSAQYYVKPNLKEYRFEPPHAIVSVDDGREHELRFRGVRVAWSAYGRVVSLSGQGVARVGVRARALEPGADCPQQDATTGPDGDFRIRGLLPDCVYSVELKESTDRELVGMELAKAPPPLRMTSRDVRDVRLIVFRRRQTTDGTVLVRAGAELCRALRLWLRPDGGAPSLAARPAAGCGPRGLAALVTLPRLPADNRTYWLRLDGGPPRAQPEPDQMLVSDGKFHHFVIELLPEVKSSEVELHQSSLLMLPLLVVLGLLYFQRHRLPNLRFDLAKRGLKNKGQ